MRILLDAHISGRTVGKALIEGGHDGRALDSEVELEGLSDPEVLKLAAAEGRVLVIANIRDFEREKRGLRRPHLGCGGDACGHQARGMAEPSGVASKSLIRSEEGRSGTFEPTIDNVSRLRVLPAP
jgi:hypothetical protein